MSPLELTCLHPVGRLRDWTSAPHKDQCYCADCGQQFSYADVVGYQYPEGMAKRFYAFTRALAGLSEGDTRPLAEFMAPGAVRALKQRSEKPVEPSKPQERELDPVWGR